MVQTAIVYGDLADPIQKKALENLSALLLEHAGCHPACFSAATAFPKDDFVVCYLGTKENNPHIRERSRVELTHENEYAISVEEREIVIEGKDDCGVLYGVSDFCNKYLTQALFCDGAVTKSPFSQEKLPKFSYQSYPKIRNRGLWTWGYTIQNYRGYFDNMVKLKLNAVVIWNDFAPLNARELVDYAHTCGIKVIFGMPWLWDVDCAAFDLSDVDRYSEQIFQSYEAQYGAVAGDGVYFQTFTELDTEYIGGYLIAEAATNFVNRTAQLFFAKYPDIELQFGLHCTSVKERSEYIRQVDPRIRIVWENCGAFPYTYTADDLTDYEGTLAYTKQIATLRGENDRFGVVPKGMVKLDWTQFRHLSGAHFIGIGTKATKASKLTEKRMVKKHAQSYWIRHAEEARNAFRVLKEAKNGDLYVLALVEDSLFDEKPFFAPALYAELVFDPDCDADAAVTEVMLREYVECD